MKPASFERDGVWRELFAAALTMTDHLAMSVINQNDGPMFTFGDGENLEINSNGLRPMRDRNGP